MNNILSITDEASDQIKKIIEHAPQGTDGIIVGVDKSGCSGYSYKIEFANNDNSKNFEYIDSKGIKVYIDPIATMFLIGSEMDYSKDKLSSRFVFNNPNEKNSCGCGESFNI
ncbi:iron-sulfur cluster assembly accessory protein [Alphaproteobacteria bacterium]|jgi:iron-sulfur cluster assembly protein|nr:iron-sulfur cluster assembly accessory protein [Alphaproteobacteria bacterium]MDC3270683.1 iron-sulfur cluster assembly accessory protein [Alphaproteobacteria bacterium]